MDTYAIGDLHGNYKGLMQAIERSPFNPEKDKLVTVGDYVDGGLHIEVLHIFKYLMSLPNWDGILGNHDKWMLECLISGGYFAENMWYNQGGKNTLDSLGIKHYRAMSGASLSGEFPPICLEFLNKLKLFHVDDFNNAYVHAGWYNQQNTIEESDSFKHDRASLYWTREFWERAGSNAYPDNPYNKVFIGHTSTTYFGSEEPMKRKNVWNLDTGAGGDGKVTIMNVNTEEFWQSDKTPELYDNFGFRN